MPELNLAAEDIVNRALARIGGGVVQSLDDETDLARAANLIYATELEAALGKYAWRFAMKPFKLSQLSGTPESGWTYAFALPGERLGFPVTVRYAADRNAILRDYELYNDELHCNHSEIWVRCIVRVDPDAWMPEFRKAIIVGIASALAVPVAHDLNLAAALAREAYGAPQENGLGGLLGQAIARDVALSPPMGGMYDSSPLADARF